MATEPTHQNSWNSDYLIADGQLLIGQTGENPIANTLTPLTGISIFNSAGVIEIGVTDQLNIEKVTADTQIVVPVNYITNGASSLQMTLPEIVPMGTVIKITDINSGFRIRQNADQFIHFGNKTTTVGTSGNIETIQTGSSVTLLCVTDDIEFSVIASVGNFKLNTAI